MVLKKRQISSDKMVRSKSQSQGWKERSNHTERREVGAQLEETWANPTFKKLMGLGWEISKNIVVFTTSETTEHLRETKFDKKPNPPIQLIRRFSQ